MLNHTTLQGRLCADPELRNTQSGTPVCSFRVAWSEKYKERETKLFLECTAWGSTGEFVSKNFHKGKEIIVSGKLSTRDWEDKQGQKRQSVELTVDVGGAHFCGPKDGGNSDYAPQPSCESAPARGEFTEADDDGQLPF